MSSTERAPVSSPVEVVAKASRRRFTVEYKRKIVREADGGKTPGAVGRCCAARLCGHRARPGLRSAPGALPRRSEEASSTPHSRRLGDP